MAKIALVIRNINYGGAAKMMTYYANIATEVFEEVYVVVIGSNQNKSIGLNSSIRIRYIKDEIKPTVRLKRILSDIRGIRKIIKDINPDIVMPFSSGNVIFTYLAVGKYHMFIGTERGNPEALPLRLRLLCKYIYPKCDYMLFQSQGAADYYFNGMKHQNYEIIANPCQVKESVHKKSETDQFKIVSFSRLAPEKNIDILLYAFHKSGIKDRSKLHIYGDGVEERNLKKLCGKLELQKYVIFHGKSFDVSEALADADIFVLASSGEGMPNGLIEAMGFGIPCISTKCMAGNTNELIEHGVNGLIVEKRDIDGLVKALEKLVIDRQLANRISLNAKKIKDQLSECVIHGKINNFYSMIKKKAEISLMENQI